MKLTVCMILLMAVIAIVHGETCNDCNHTHCDGGYHIGCNAGTCTCVQTGTTCTSNADCGPCPNHHGHEECINGDCHCPGNNHHGHPPNGGR